MSSFEEPAPRFVITGCGRSGTGYVSTLLNRIGIPCGHEALFRPSKLLGQAQLDWPVEIPGDASWLAAPFVEALPPGTVVLHQVREPAAVVRSFLRIRFFDEPSPYRDFAEQLCPALAQGTALERCCRYWLEWNRFAARAATAAGIVYRRYRLEDLDLDLVLELCQRIGQPVSQEVAASALHALPRDVNTRGSKERDHEVDAEALPAEVRTLAAEYGYEGPGALPSARPA